MQDSESPIIKELREERESSLERLIMLSDGVFAIAMTLLVLDIKIPAGDGDFQAGLHELGTKTIFYLITFLIISVYWRFHNTLMRNIKHIDSRFTQLSLLYLASVAFFPAAMNLLAEHGSHPEAVILYVAVLVICGLLGQALRIYAFRNKKLIYTEISNKNFIRATIAWLFFPTYISLSLLLLFIPYFQSDPSSVFWFWLLIPVLVFSIRFIAYRKTGRVMSNTDSESI